ncbi:hypothetical protein [Natronorubrum sulfidifaciens]|uniref:hypothetical protein n=1 Tax=Natronorubrum sulfidifaciens TaxID=388259 RepID=UPI001267662D|nr:hypothetical protein [Natronorubrum sulfidifaciens]
MDTVTTGEVREIARKWITGRITTRDIDDVREFGWGDLPGYGFEAGNGTDLVKLPCLEDVEEGDEIPVTAPVEHVPASAPPQMNPATIEDLMDEITGQDEVDGGGSEKQLVTDGGFGIGEVDVGDKVIMRFQGAKYDPWTVESVDGDDVEISRRGFTRSLTRYDLAAFEPRPTVDGFDAPITTGVCAMDGCDKRLEDCEVPVQGYCGPVHAQDDLYDGDFALDTADVAGFSPEVPR